MFFSLFIIYSLFFGFIIGSFLNCLIWRLHTGETILDRSRCPKCGKAIAWYDNIPIFSYLFLLGKCRHCHEHISIQYPVVELITGLLFAFAFYINGSVHLVGNELFFDANLIITIFRDFFLISVMIIVFIYDLRWYLILDIVSLPAIAILFVVNLFLGFEWQYLLLAGAVGGGFFLLQFIISRGRWVGGGDIRLGVLMGVALGWPAVITALMLSYVTGSVIGIGLIAFSKKKWGSQIPFGVFLSTATIVTLFWGDYLVGWYLGLINI